jgi:hypothetical protein
MYCDESGNIFNSLKKSLQDFLYPHPNIILITVICFLKITEICDGVAPEYYTIWHNWVKKGNDKW